MSCTRKVLSYKLKPLWFPKLYSGMQYKIELTYKLQFPTRVYAVILNGTSCDLYWFTKTDDIYTRDKTTALQELEEFSHGKCLQCGNIVNCQFKQGVEIFKPLPKLDEFKDHNEITKDIKIEKAEKQLENFDNGVKKLNELKGKVEDYLKK